MGCYLYDCGIKHYENEAEEELGVMKIWNHIRTDVFKNKYNYIHVKHSF